MYNTIKDAVVAGMGVEFIPADIPELSTWPRFLPELADFIDPTNNSTPFITHLMTAPRNGIMPMMSAIRHGKSSNKNSEVLRALPCAFGDPVSWVVSSLAITIDSITLFWPE
jgi:hypothetical protein